AIFRKWELDFAVIGHVTDTERLVLTFEGATVADIPLGPLADKAPLYDRPHVPTPARAELDDLPDSDDLAADLLRLLACPDLASKRWIWEQYDHMVGADTIQRPGGDSAVVRVHGTRLALAITTDCTPRYCFADPVAGGRQAVAETWRNLTSVGARPLAITDCMNFGNPQRPEIMGQFVGCIEGMADACRVLDYPVVSGNVSLYNETNGTGILPTPAIGGVGLIDDYARMMTLAFKAPDEAIIVIGATAGHLGQSLYLRECLGREDGPPPPVDLAAERRNGDFVRATILGGGVTAVHDLSGGGLAVALATMALAGDIGATASGFATPGAAFGEDQARYLVTTRDAAGLLAAAVAAGVPATAIGHTGGNALDLDGWTVSLAALRAAHEATLPALMISAA
ncbi:MAG: AIR synthase related protein, partial [Janthinobacterium lividum]